MSEPNTVEPVVTVVEVPVEVKTYEYQPTDQDGRPIGGKQVIKYTTQEELVDKLTNQSVHQIRKMRDQERKLRLGILESDQIDESAPRLETPLEFKTRSLGNDERFQLSQDMLDPERFDGAIDTVIESRFGVKPSELVKTITDLQATTFKINTQRESDAFMAKNPDYIACQENSQAIANWIARYGLAPVAENFQKAFNTLKSAGVLITSLEVITQEQPKIVEEVVKDIVIPVKEEPTRQEIPLDNQPQPVVPVVSRVPAGLSKSNSSNVGIPAVNPADEIVYEYVQRDSSGRQVGEKRVFKGHRAIEAMPSEEYKRRLLHEKGFAAKVEKLEKKG